MTNVLVQRGIAIRVFVSYTLRDKLLSKKKLRELKNALKPLSYLTTYIDILDNNNKESPQDEVIKQLKQADIVWLINSSDEVNKSEWVRKEIEIAKQYKKTIYQLTIEGFEEIILAKEQLALINLVSKYIRRNNRIRPTSRMKSCKNHECNISRKSIVGSTISKVVPSLCTLSKTLIFP